MGLFGKSKDDTSQDTNIKEIWKWLQALNTNQQSINKNQSVLIKNNSYFIEATDQLQQKDQLHDRKDSEHDTLIQSIKSMAKAIEETEDDSCE